MRRLDGITDSMDVSLSVLEPLVVGIFKSEASGAGPGGALRGGRPRRPGDRGGTGRRSGWQGDLALGLSRDGMPQPAVTSSSLL